MAYQEYRTTSVIAHERVKRAIEGCVCSSGMRLATATRPTREATCNAVVSTWLFTSPSAECTTSSAAKLWKQASGAPKAAHADDPSTR